MAEGPSRFIGNQPFYDTSMVLLPTAGVHVVAFHVHSVGSATRLLLETPPVVACNVESSDPVGHPITKPVWRCTALAHYKPQWRRLSTLLGWAENCTVEADLLQFTEVAFDDSTWTTPVAAIGAGTLKAPIPLEVVVGPASSQQGGLDEIDHGSLWEQFGCVCWRPVRYHCLIVTHKLPAAPTPQALPLPLFTALPSASTTVLSQAATIATVIHNPAVMTEPMI